MSKLTAKRVRGIVRGSVRDRVVRECAKHPGGVMNADLSAWLEVSIKQVRKATRAATEAGELRSVDEPVRVGGSAPQRYFHPTHWVEPVKPAPAASAPAPPPMPKPVERIVSFADLGVGRYLPARPWAEAVASGAPPSQWGGL